MFGRSAEGGQLAKAARGEFLLGVEGLAEAVERIGFRRIEVGVTEGAHDGREQVLSTVVRDDPERELGSEPRETLEERQGGVEYGVVGESVDAPRRQRIPVIATCGVRLCGRRSWGKSDQSA